MHAHRRFALLLVTIAASVWLASSQATGEPPSAIPGGAIQPEEGVPPTTAAVTAELGGILLSPDGRTQVTFPPGAVHAPVTTTATSLKRWVWGADSMRGVNMSPMTVSAWVYVSSWTGSPRIVAKGLVYHVLLDPANGRVQGNVRNSSGSWAGSDAASVNASITMGSWRHVAMVYNGSTLQMYVNGVASGSSVTQTGTVADTGYALTMGSDNGTSQFLSGKLDDIRIYTRALSAAEVSNPGAPSALYNESYAYNPSGNITNKNGVAYTYGDFDHKHAVTAVGATTYADDATAT